MTHLSPERPRFGVELGNHHRTWAELRDGWQTAEALGFDVIWNWDHFLGLGGDVDADSLEAWALIAALAAETQRMRMGTLVCSITHRHPAVLAKQAVTVDHISGGRLELGLGAGWNNWEHHAYGIPFPSARERVDRFEEAIALIDALFRQDHPTVNGRYYQLNRAPFSPRPLQRPRIPILVGSAGTRMLRSVARYGDIWHTGGAPEYVAERGALLNRYCQEIGRDPNEIRWSVSITPEQWSSEARFRRDVRAHAATGVRDFYLQLDIGVGAASLRPIAESAIAEIRATWPDVPA